MKTLALNIFLALVIVLGIAESSNAATVKNNSDNVTVLTDISNISKIEIHGNVELYISDGAADKVKVYNKYYGENALVKSNNGVLSIASYKAEKLVVWVTANDLRQVSAFDNAVVKSFGNISKIEFNVDLHNNAVAKLDLDAFSAAVTVADNARVDLSGRVEEYYLKYDREENVNQKELATVHATRKLDPAIAAARTLDLADL